LFCFYFIIIIIIVQLPITFTARVPVLYYYRYKVVGTSIPKAELRKKLQESGSPIPEGVFEGVLPKTFVHTPQKIPILGDVACNGAKLPKDHPG
jgi:hypothetical protein